MWRVSPDGGALALDDRDDLVLLADQHVEQADGHLGHRRGDGLDAVAADAEVVALLDRPGVAAGLPDGLGDLARHDRGRGLAHGLGVAVGGGLGVVGQQGGEALGGTPGGHHPDRLVGLGVDLAGHGDDVLVVGEDDDLVGRHRLDDLEQLRRRRVHGLAAEDDALHAEAVEDAADAVTGADGDDRGGHRRGADDAVQLGGGVADPALLLDLLEQVGHPDLAGAAAVQGGLDGVADVVGVDVAVPEAVAADDHDRVADAGPHVLERRDGRVRAPRGGT